MALGLRRCRGRGDRPAAGESDDGAGLSADEPVIAQGSDVALEVDGSTTNSEAASDPIEKPSNGDSSAVADANAQIVVSPPAIALHGSEDHLCAVGPAGTLYLATSSGEWRVLDRAAVGDFSPAAVFCPGQQTITVVGSAESGTKGLILDFDLAGRFYTESYVEAPLVAIHGSSRAASAAVAVGTLGGRQMLFVRRELKWERYYETEQPGALNDVWVADDGQVLAVGDFGLVLHGAEPGATPELGRLNDESLQTVTAKASVDGDISWVLGAGTGTYHGSPASGWQRVEIGTDEVIDLYAADKSGGVYALTRERIYWRSGLDDSQLVPWDPLELSVTAPGASSAIYGSASFPLVIASTAGTVTCSVTSGALENNPLGLYCR